MGRFVKIVTQRREQRPGKRSLGGDSGLLILLDIPKVIFAIIQNLGHKKFDMSIR